MNGVKARLPKTRASHRDILEKCGGRRDIMVAQPNAYFIQPIMPHLFP